MSKYRVKYNEGDHINKTIVVEAESCHDALVLFTACHPNADFTSIEEVI